MSTLDKIRTVISCATGIELHEIQLNYKFQDMDLDSLEWLEMMTEIQKECGDLPDEIITSLNTVGDLLAAYDPVPN